MDTPLRVIALWTLAAVAIWLVLMVLAFNFALDHYLFAYVAQHGLCGGPPCPRDDRNAHASLTFAIVAASIVTTLLGWVVAELRKAGRPA